MKAIIISIGDELLIGQTINTNAAWMGSEMSRLGFSIVRTVAVSDKREDILQILGESEGNADVVLITGGLGPTSDDITKPVLCEFFGTRLVENSEVLEMIKEMISRRNGVLNEKNRKQAEVPESCRVLFNAAGTAPGMWFEKAGTIFISMPGVPGEMKHLMSVQVLPELSKRFTTQVIIHRNIMLYGEAEARLAERLTSFEAGLPESVKLAYLPSYGIIKLRLTATGKERIEVEKIVDKQVEILSSIIPELIYSFEEEGLETTVGKLLMERKATLCTAESCTGGNIARMITSVAGSSRYFLGSVVAYDNSVKISQLKVPVEMIVEHGAVSKEVAVAMSEGARKLFGASYAIAVTGIAGPDGGTAEKPVGTVCISVSSPSRTISSKLVFGSDRLINISRFSTAALDMLRRAIFEEGTASGN